MNAPAAPPSPTSPSEPREGVHEARLITAIGIFKLSKGLLLLGAAMGTFELLGRDLEEVVDRLVALVRLSPDSRLVDWLYTQADAVTDHTLKVVASVGVVYGTLLVTEGYGLLRRRTWAELLVVIGTLIPVPFELYELFHEPSFKKVGVLTLNLLIVGYLIRRRREFSTRAQREAEKVAAESVPHST
jgi:uncharacterized membrane protein (DUF2068 family)